MIEWLETHCWTTPTVQVNNVYMKQEDRADPYSKEILLKQNTE